MNLKQQENQTKVVIDTNVIISAAISEDNVPAEIFELLLLEEVENYTSQEIIDEVINVFHRPKFIKLISEKDINFMVEKYLIFSKKVEPKQKFSLVKDDSKDNMFIDCAVEANVDYIISGDPHLLGIKVFKNIKIITPREFLEMINL